jgi:hypothetical protein
MTKKEPQQPKATTPQAPETFLELRRELRELPAKKRLERIIERRDAMRVVRALPVQDLYATLREVGIEDALEVLELCSPRQVQAFLDLDGWRGDRIDQAAISTWLRALIAANPDRAVGQIRGLDVELLTLLFKLHARVYDLSAEEQPEGDVGLHSITPDQRYLIVYGGVGADERMQHALKELVDRLLGRDTLFILRLCEAVRWELPSSLEEESFKWRNARLADLGIQPRHEALEIFAWRDPDAPLDERPTAPPPPPYDPEAPSSDLSTSVMFPWEVLKDGAAALAQATKDLPVELQERTAQEIMLVANRVHVADGGDAGDPEALRATARQVIDTVGIALSYRCAGDPSRLMPLLASTPVPTLFRVGHSLALKLQKELRARIAAKDSGLSGHGLLRLDAPLRETAAGLLRARPLLYRGLLDATRDDYRPPASLLDLAAMSRAVVEIGFRGALLGPRGFGVTDEALAALGITDAANMPSHGAAIGALLVRALLELPHAVAPITDEELALAKKAFAAEEKRKAAVDVLIARAKSFAPLPGAQTADDVATRARTYVGQVMDAMARELLDVERDPEGRFLATVWAKS